MRFEGICYRAHDPRWSFSPISGAGAAIRGQRFNPKGTEALYLALTIEGAFLEITQGFPLKFLPCTFCSYDVDCDDLADLRTEKGRQKHSVDFNDMSCGWLNALADKKIPPSWHIANRLIDKGFAGILVPCFASGATADMTNLVLWKWSDKAPHQVAVIDPEERLPKNQRSWDR